MVQVCTRCQRANPPQAVYCHFDGSALTSGGGLPMLLPREFPFPSGRLCRSIDELTQGCHLEWPEARAMLLRGDLFRYLQDVGRHDLANLAAETKAQADPDLALFQFLSGMPPVRDTANLPLLDFGPRRVHVPGLRIGEEQSVTITVANRGQGPLLGRVAVADDCPWLRLDGTLNGRECPVKAGREQTLTLIVDSKGLIAGQSYSGKLTLVTNGGLGEIPVRLDVEAMPFAKPPLEGADNHRDLALRMRANPRAAAPLVEDGSVADWFSANGWSYPVVGPAARGVGSVQQFFEAMGLARPPMLVLSQSEVLLEATSAQPIKGFVALRTPEKKWVYAEVTSDAPWLKPLAPMFSGPLQVTISFEIDPTAMDEGDNVGQLQLHANGRLPMAVRVMVKKPRTSRPTPAASKRPVAPKVPKAAKAPTPAGEGSVLRALEIGALCGLALRLLLMLPGDLFARMAVVGDGPAPGTFAFWLASPLGSDEEGFLGRFILATFWLGMVGCVVLARKKGQGIRDLIYPLCAGAVAGAVLAATFAFVLDLYDAVPRALLGLLPASTPGMTATLTWLILAPLCWALPGALIGVMIQSRSMATHSLTEPEA